MAAPKTEICLAQEVQHMLEKIAQQEGYTSPKFDVSMGTKPGDNYIGIVYRVKVDDNDKKTLSLIVKYQPLREEMLVSFDTELFFQKEAHFYNFIYPALKNFQLEHGIPDEELSPLVPRCYHASHFLVLQDMSTHGYMMLDRKITLDLEHCVLVLRDLARLHALSLALKHQRPNVYSEITADVHEGFMVPSLDPHLAEIFDYSVDKAMEVFKERHAHVQNYNKYVAAIDKFFDGYYDKLLRLVSREDADPYDVINHGDSWTNNFLFKYSLKKAAPESLCLLDFQAVRLCSPAIDISYFIHHCTDKSLRDKHYDDMINGYYQSLAGFLKRLGSRPEVVFPRSALDDQLQRFSRFAMALSTFELPTFTSDVVDVGNTALNEEACWRRMGDVFMDMVDRGYLD